MGKVLDKTVFFCYNKRKKRKEVTKLLGSIPKAIRDTNFEKLQHKNLLKEKSYDAEKFQDFQGYN
jgi:hypothetical protein